PLVADMDPRARRTFHMLATSVLDRTTSDEDSLESAAVSLWRHPQVLAELGELMEVLQGRIDHVQTPLSTHPDVPLYVHARYTRLEILAAFSDGTSLAVPTWREGVRYLPEEQVDLFAFTLDKSSGQFSPTT